MIEIAYHARVSYGIVSYRVFITRSTRTSTTNLYDGATTVHYFKHRPKFVNRYCRRALARPAHQHHQAASVYCTSTTILVRYVRVWLLYDGYEEDYTAYHIPMEHACGLIIPVDVHII